MMAPYSVGHEHHLLPASEYPQDDFCRQGSCRIYPHVSMGSSQPEGDSGRTSTGRRKPVSRVQASIEEKNQSRPRFTQTFRLLWVLLSRVWDPWHQMAQLMQPATVKRWHTRAFRLYWRRKSRRHGRPPIAKEMRNMNRKLSRRNPLWSAKRIRDTLRLLGCDPSCSDTIRKYRVHHKYSLS